MKKTVKNILHIFFHILWPIILLAIICLIGLLVMNRFFIFSGICRNDIINEIISPDGKKKAILFQRDCGATTGFSTQISIISTNKYLSNDAGNIFITDGHPNENKIEINWLSSRKVVISNIPFKKDIYKKERVFKKIEIIYRDRE